MDDPRTRVSSGNLLNSIPIGRAQTSTIHEHLSTALYCHARKFVATNDSE